MIRNDRYIPLHGRLTRDGLTLECVERPEIESPKDACLGCYLRKQGMDCNGIQCSKFDRRDGKFVWFVRMY